MLIFSVRRRARLGRTRRCGCATAFGKWWRKSKLNQTTNKHWHGLTRSAHEISSQTCQISLREHQWGGMSTHVAQHQSIEFEITNWSNFWASPTLLYMYTGTNPANIWVPASPRKNINMQCNMGWLVKMDLHRERDIYIYIYYTWIYIYI